MMACEMFDRLLSEDIFIPTLIAASVVLCVAFKTVGSMVRSTAREKTRREIAAYIAEGSMTPEQGERLMRAGDSSRNV
jgi:hypothetical protein